MEFETVGRDYVGDILFKTLRVHALDIIDNLAPRSGVGDDSGVKAENIQQLAGKTSIPIVTCETAIVTELPPVTREFRVEMFETHEGAKTIHND